MKNKFILFVIILTLAAGIAGFWYYQKNIYSREGLKLEIFGPESVELAEEIEYIVKYKNNGNARLEEPRLIFEYPKYSILEEGQNLRQEIVLQDIYPGEEKTLRFKARLLGKEGETKEVRAWLSYRPKNLKARYTSDTTFTTIIKKVLLTLEFDLPSQIESGKDLRFRLNYFSNTDYPLLNLRAAAEYPSGFEFIESVPSALEKTEWELSPLNKTEGGRIEIVGKVRGEIKEQKLFRARLGSWQAGEFVLLKETVKGVEIVKPALRVSQQINGNPEYAANLGDRLHYEIFFKNVGEGTLTDLSLLTTLVGDIFDLNTLKAPEGEFTLGDNSIMWEWRRVADLQFLDFGEEGRVEFWVKLKENWEIPSLEGKTTIKSRIYLSQVKEDFVTKVNSKLEISQAGYFQDEVFGNSGPIPPKVGKTTTYTVTWLVKNYYNEVKNIKVKATLPQNVKLTSKIFPEAESEKFTFDSVSREIVWEVGELRVGQGVLNPAPNISFQIVFRPDLTQKGKIPEIISEAKISGADQWTGETLEAIAQAVDTTLPDDPTVSEEQGIVQ